jgi:hypothetical protein
MPARSPGREEVWTLPPLILHPFSDSNGPGQLVESSRAGLMLQGLLPGGDRDREDLEKKLLAGRYCEFRMLFYVGKDLTRWIDQCLEFVAHTPELAGEGIRFQSFAGLLVYDPPESVKEKLRRWGVVDYKGIFSRGIGIHSVFSEPPARSQLSDEFLRNYYRYADHLFAARLNLNSYTELNPRRFDFALYASGEYTQLLERQWEEI